MRLWQLEIDDTGSEEGMPLYIAQSGDLDRCYRCLTDSQTLKYRATQLLIKYNGGALVTQYCFNNSFGAEMGWICMFARPNSPKILTFFVKYFVPTTLNVGAALTYIFTHYLGWQMETAEYGRVAVNRKL